MSLNVDELIQELQKMSDGGLGLEPAYALAEGVPPQTVHHVEAEYAEASGGVTVWLRCEEA